MTKVAVATTSQLAADGANEIALRGGNAVDCALAAALFTINTQPGVCALAGSAYVTVWGPGSEPITIDGNVAVPGSGLAEADRDLTASNVTLDYGGGVATLAGTSFGPQGEGFLRLSYANSLENIEKALGMIESVLQRVS